MSRDEQDRQRKPITHQISATTDGIDDELNLALPSGQPKSTSSDMRKVVDKIARMPERFSELSAAA